MTLEEIDKTGLMREAYRIVAITDAECRSIFVDWALKLPDGITPQAAISQLLQAYAETSPDHPMTAVLRAGLAQPDRPRRRGGRAARRTGL